MAAIARALVAEFERQVTARGQRLVLDAAAAVPSPLPAALAQVLMRNLIDNAVRYSPDGALVRISVGCSPEGGAGRLVVEDSGRGSRPMPWRGWVSASSVWSDRHRLEVGWDGPSFAGWPGCLNLTLLWIAVRHWVDCA
jgi:hypothetical protein